MEWCRLYSDIVDNKKINELSPKNFKIFIFLLAICAKTETNGVIVDDEKTLAWRMRESEKSIKKALENMVSAEIIIRVDGLYKIKNWESRQFKSDDVSDRVKRFREKKKQNCNVTSNVASNENVTPQIRAEQIQSRTESKSHSEKPPFSANAHSLAILYLSTVEPDRKARIKERDILKWKLSLDKTLKRYSFAEIERAIKAGRCDQFWAKNFLSPAKLESKNKDGVPFMEVFLALKAPSSSTIGHNPAPTDTSSELDRKREALKMYEDNRDNLDPPGLKKLEILRREVAELEGEAS